MTSCHIKSGFKGVALNGDLTQDLSCCITQVYSDVKSILIMGVLFVGTKTRENDGAFQLKKKKSILTLRQ